MTSLAGQVDWVEAHNARIAVGKGNQLAAEFAREHALPGIAVSDAHSSFEVGVAYTAFETDPSTPSGLLAALADVELVMGRASLYVRLLTPLAKVVQRARGNGRVDPAGDVPAAVR
ncbi:MAG TPA: PHP-associated domain-containing protein [Verrucomicrobiae bacterium]|nr:PHP-associated domain-containing protein [Verrucomicrobiae bacterium]